MMYLLGIPDFQKQRQYHLEQGVKFFKNAIFDKDFYDDAIVHLHKAEKLEPTDYFTLHKLGLFYCFSPQYLDIPLAEKYFRKASKYAYGETHSESIRSKNYLAADVRSNFATDVGELPEVIQMTAESFLLTGMTCYIQGKFREAVKESEMAVRLLPEQLDLKLVHAKFLVANQQGNQAAKVVEEVLTRSRNLVFKVLSDVDMACDQHIQLLLRKFQKDANHNVLATIEECKRLMIPNSQAHQVIKNIQSTLKSGTYMAALEAQDKLEESHNWSLPEYISPQEVKNGEKEFHTPKIYENYSVWLNVKEFIKTESFCFDKIPWAKQEIEKAKIRWLEAHEFSRRKAMEEDRKLSRQLGFSMIPFFGALGVAAGFFVIGPINWIFFDGGYIVPAVCTTLISGAIGFVVGNSM